MQAKYRVLERFREDKWEPFAIAFLRESRVWLFTPAWRAPRPLPVSDLEQLSTEHIPGDGALYRWAQDIGAADDGVYHPIQLFRAAMAPTWQGFRRPLMKAHGVTDILPGQESSSLLSTARPKVSQDSLDCLGKALRLMVGYLADDRDRRPKFRNLITLANFEDRPSRQAELVLLANRFEFPAWAVQCLPSLYFVLVNGNRSQRITVAAWHPIAVAVPKSFNLEMKERLCGGEVLVVTVEKAGASLLRRIAAGVEPHRLSNPFASDSSVKGIVAEALDSIQLEDPEIAKVAEEAQKNVLIEAGVGFGLE